MNKKICFSICVVFLFLTLCSCKNNAEKKTYDDVTVNAQSETNPTSEIKQSEEKTSMFNGDSRIIEVSALKGTICIPNDYYVFGDDYEYTDQMCNSIGLDSEKMSLKISSLQGQTLLVPANVQYNGNNAIYIKVKDKKYEDITLSDLTQVEFDLLVSTIVKSFGTSEYSVVEGNGLRYFVFSANQGLGNVTRYATILNGHMVYIYWSTGENTITQEQQSILENIALSVKHGL